MIKVEIISVGTSVLVLIRISTTLILINCIRLNIITFSLYTTVINQRKMCTQIVFQEFLYGNVDGYRTKENISLLFFAGTNKTKKYILETITIYKKQVRLHFLK